MRKLVLLVIFLAVSSGLGIEKTSRNFTITADFPETVTSSEFTFPVIIQNLAEEERIIEVYSYVYQGSKSVSGAWNGNSQIIKIRAFENKSLNLTNYLKEVNGLYAIKLRVREAEKDVDVKGYINISQILKNSEITGYSVMKPVAYSALSVLGLAALYLVMRRI